MRKVYRNPFEKYVRMLNTYGTIVDFNEGGDGDGAGDAGSTSGSVDLPGGKVSEGDASQGDGGSGDNADTMHQSAGSDSGDSGDADGDSGDDSSDGGDDSGDQNDIDKRFGDLNGKIDNLLSMFNKANSGDDGDKGGKSDDSDDVSLEHDDLVEMLADDPAGFVDKLTSAIEKKVSGKVAEDMATKQYNDNVEKVINEYADSNEDFEKMWDSGDIQKFIEKNPGHNAISAHMTLTMEAKLEEARKEGAEKAIADFRTKSNNQVLTGNSAIPPDQRDAALKDTRKFGGRAAVVAARAGIK